VVMVAAEASVCQSFQKSLETVRMVGVPSPSG